MRLIRRLHHWAGLLTFVNLTLYGIIGMAAFAGGGFRAELQPRAAYDRPFTAPPDAADREVAEAVCRALNLTLALPVQSVAISRDASHHLALDLYHANGRHKITVDEAAHSIHVEEFRAPLTRFLDILHISTIALRTGDTRLTIWTYFNEFAMWALALMLLTGAAIAVQRGGLIVWIAFSTGTVLTLATLAWTLKQ